MTTYRKSERTTLHRFAENGSYDRDLIHGIVDRAHLCHIGMIQNGSPVVIPCLHGREGDLICFHGSRASRLLATLTSGANVCLTFTILNGLVMARSAFAHSAQYESVVAYGSGYEITGEESKLRALKAISDHLFPGRWEDVRPPSDQELNATCVAGVIVTEASAKISSEGVSDRPADMDWPTWAGVIPSHTAFGPPVQDPAQPAEIKFPDYLKRLL